jgi:hypothetical protein
MKTRYSSSTVAATPRPRTVPVALLAMSTSPVTTWPTPAFVLARVSPPLAAWLLVSGTGSLEGGLVLQDRCCAEPEGEAQPI